MEFLVLGPLEVRSEGRSLTLPGRRQRALLVLLLLRANAVVSADALVEGLWGERPPRTAAHTVQVFVSDLRKALRGAGEDGRIVTQPPGYRIEVRPGELDLERFEQLAVEGRASLGEGEPSAAASALRDALRLWRGDPLADFAYEPFAHAPVARLEELRLTVLEDRVAADLQLGRHAELVGELEALVAQHPYREGLRRHLMLALYRAGRQSEALAVYQATRTLLVDELGIDPTPDLQELERAILLQDPALELAVPDQKPVAPSEKPRLPTPPTPLVGRERELAALVELVLAQRLVTVTGPGGMGKTRIALAACERLQGSFEDGARFVQLAALSDPGLLPATLALALELEERPGEELTDTISRALHQRELLLCLDNMEQLPEAAPILAELLSRCPRLRLLATSRSRLRLAGEHEYPLPPLEDDEAVQLFADRASAVSPGFALPEHEQTVTAICERLDRLPLALELAAARIKLLPPPALLERLDRSLKLLTGGARDLPERHQTLHAAIEWSYQLLTPDERRLFRGLAVFAGGFTLEAAAAVTEQDELQLLERLSALVEHSLARRVEDGEGPRFTLLHVLREYAGERLDASGEAEPLRRAHALWCIALATESQTLLDSGGAQSQTLRRLEREHDNFRAALGWAVEREEQALAVRLVARLGWFWFLRGYLTEAHEWIGRVLAWRSVEPEDRELLVARAGSIAFKRGDFAGARDHYEESLALRRRLDRHEDVPAMLGNLGSVAAFEGDYERAAALLEESVELAREVGDQIGIAAGLCNLAEAVLFGGDPERARALAEEAIDLARELEHPWGLSVSLGTFAGALLDMGETEAAVTPLGESVRLTVELGDVVGLADRLEMLAETAVAGGRAERAAELLGAAEALRDAVGAPRTRQDERRIGPCTAEARRILGEIELERVLSRGRQLTRDEAVAVALDEAEART